MKIVPKDWRQFQHYKDRSPPWIRLHKSLLDNFEFQRLPIASRALAPMLWLLASEYVDGVIDARIDRLSFRMRMSEAEIAAALKPLIDAGFFSVVGGDSDTLAACLRDAVPEAEAEAEAEKAPTALVDPPAANRPPACPTEEIVGLYHEHLPMLPRVEVLNDARRRTISARWREVVTDQDIRKAPDVRRAAIEWFAWYFGHCARSRFLTGKAKDWRADLDFLMTPSKFAKAVEGSYHKEAA